MLPNNWQELNKRFKEMMKEDPRAFDTTFEALEKLRCLIVLWGLEDSGKVSFHHFEEKQHTLLAYKYLDIVWFDELPAIEASIFNVLIRAEIPRSATLEKVLQTFGQSNEVLIHWCANISRPSWIDRETKFMTTSLALFPLRTRGS